MTMDSFLYDFCGGRAFFELEKLNQDRPELSICFVETVLVWIPYGFLWIALVPFAYYVYQSEEKALPMTKIQILKTTLTVILFCIEIASLILQLVSEGFHCDVKADIPDASFVATAVKTATFLLVIVLEQFMRYKGVNTSGVPFIFWCLLGISAIVTEYVVAIEKVWCTTSTLTTVALCIIWIQIILRCFVDKYKRDQLYTPVESGQCPEETASVLNRVTYYWLTPLVVKAYKETLNSKVLWNQTKRLRSNRLVAKFLNNWNYALKKLQRTRLFEPPPIDLEKIPLLANGTATTLDHENKPRNSHEKSDSAEKPSLFRVLFKTFLSRWAEACCYKLIGDVFNLLQPILLRELIATVEARDSKDGSERPVWIGYAFTVILFITGMLKTVFYHCSFNHMIVIGLSVKCSLIGAIYRKALTMSNSARKTSTVGEIVSLMSVDCQRIQDAFTYSAFITSLIFITAVTSAQVYMLMGGWSMLGGLAVVIVAIVVNACLGVLQQKLQKQILAFKGSRVKILNELIGGIKVLKMYTWEKPFQQKVKNIRSEEIKRLWRYAVYSAVTIFFSVHSPFMVNYVLVLIYTLSSSIHYLDAQTAFTVLALVNLIRGPIVMTPFIVTGVVQGQVSIKRCQNFLVKEDIDDDNVQVVDKGKPFVKIQDGNFTWDPRNKKPNLSNINLHVKRGQLLAVVGPVGAGKTSLISAVLGEMQKISGTVAFKGSLAYVPQEAWIQNLTLRDNILFGRTMDRVRYSKVLSTCALLPDLEILQGGDMTEIGEKGINISGGQKQRVSLARAVYNDADIYLMDDPLSAVDSHVGKHLFRNVIGNQGMLKHKTRILVTHGIHWLPMVDKIVVLNDGNIAEYGTYEELISRGGVFAQFLKSYLDQDAESEQEEDAEVRQMKEKILSDVESATSGNFTSADETESTEVRRRSLKRSVSAGSPSQKLAAKSFEKKQDQATSGRLIQEEQSQKGAVKLQVFTEYAKAMGIFFVIMVFVSIIAFQTLNIFSNYWLTFWTEDQILKNTTLGHTDEYETQYEWYLIWYTAIGVIQGFAIMAFGYFALTRMVKASSTLHNRMLESILRSPMSFFDTTPIGRIMNRFSSDIDIMDDRLPLTFRLWAIQIFSMFATIIVVCINTPYFIAVLVPIMMVYVFLLKFYLPTARQVKRIESVLRSPIYNHFSETISGVTVIRAYKCAKRFMEEMDRRADTNIKFFFAANTASRWIGVRLEFLGNILILAASIFALLTTGLNGAEVGLSITYALQITISLNLVIQAISEMEMNIVAAERVEEYTVLPPEAAWEIKGKKPALDWPQKGCIDFNMYTTRYREGLDLVLRGIRCTINPSEKVGIVGRTGAGKSSLTLSLFRIIEAAGGSIIIDGQNIADLGLHDLRSKITILPQDPVIFSGSLRSNLDPFSHFDDAALWKALECAHLKNTIDNLHSKLDSDAGEGGSNFSMGERQLICLARALLHKTKVLILDEATAAVDLETDDLIQNTIRTEFSSCTVISIAHRLNTIMDYDRVMVLSDGRVVEFDSPGSLLRNQEGVFYKMALDAGLV